MFVKKSFSRLPGCAVFCSFQIFSGDISYPERPFASRKTRNALKYPVEVSLL